MEGVEMETNAAATRKRRRKSKSVFSQPMLSQSVRIEAGW
jgi:hypothetical protein